MATLRQLEISAEWVRGRTLENLPLLLGLDQPPEVVREMQGSMAFVFPEIEDQAESIFAVPGVLDWFHELYTEIPNVPYFLVPHPMAGGLQSLLLCDLDEDLRETSIETGEIFLPESTLEWLASRMVATADYATHMGDDWERVVTEFLEPLGAGSDSILGRVRQLV